MYEPKYLPKVNSNVLSLEGINYGIIYIDKHIDPNDPKNDPLHLHKQLEIFFSVDCDVSFLVNNHLYPLANGNAVISKANDIHVCIFNNSQNHAYYCLWIDADFSSPLFSFLNAKEFSPLVSFDEAMKKNVLSALNCLYELNQKNGSKLAQTAYLLRILAILEKSDSPETSQMPLPVVLQAVLDDINENFVSMNHISDILKKHYISAATLNRYFRKHLHTSPHEYLESQKLSYAAKLLSEGKSVTEACMNSGFSDCSRFIMHFKRKFAMTPMQYKKEFWN